MLLWKTLKQIYTVFKFNATEDDGEIELGKIELGKITYQWAYYIS